MEVVSGTVSTRTCLNTTARFPSAGTAGGAFGLCG